MTATNKDLLELGTDELSLLETMDHVLNRGLVLAGEITISVADIDLIFVGLNVLLGSVDTIHEVLGEREQFQKPNTKAIANPSAGEPETDDR